MNDQKISKMLHDMNNILCSLNGYAEMLLDIEERDYEKKMLAHMHMSIMKLKYIIEDAYNNMNKEET